jgi:D-tyrosyl-tRNA(Tyr) deacylase
MRAVVQRVSRAEVRVSGDVVGAIERGLVVFVGAARDDTVEDAGYLARKVVGLRVFEDESGQMNQSLGEVDGARILAVSQFTLLGDCRKGRRPSFIDALEPRQAETYYEEFVRNCRSLGATVETGTFRAMMEVELINDGPVTILLDSRKLF